MSGIDHPGFFEKAGPFTLDEVAQATGAEIAGREGDGSALSVSDVQTLSDAGPGVLSFFDNRKYLDQLLVTKAGACLVAPVFADKVPEGTIALIMKAPYHGFARALQLFYPDAMRSKAGELAEANSSLIHPTAVLEDGAEIETGAIIGAQAEIGRGTRVAAGAVVGYRTHVGRDCYIGSNCVVVHTLMGDRVTLHPGVRVGQDGFGFAMGREGHLKVPQIGRVILQDDVEIGANSAVDRGALKDTVIGQGTKIDNLVQIGHNVLIGRHCVIVGQTGISGSTTIGDFVVMGGQSGTVGHIKVGDGAQIAGGCHPKNDVPPGARMGGTPGRPFRQWAREIAALSKLAGGS